MIFSVCSLWKKYKLNISELIRSYTVNVSHIGLAVALALTQGATKYVDIHSVSIILIRIFFSAYRNWMNSLGVSPYVNWLYSDLADGLIIFQVRFHNFTLPGLILLSELFQVWYHHENFSRYGMIMWTLPGMVLLCELFLVWYYYVNSSNVRYDYVNSTFIVWLCEFSQVWYYYMNSSRYGSIILLFQVWYHYVKSSRYGIIMWSLPGMVSLCELFQVWYHYVTYSRYGIIMWILLGMVSLCELF